MNIWEHIATWLLNYGIKSAGMASLRGTYEVDIPNLLKTKKNI